MLRIAAGVTISGLMVSTALAAPNPSGTGQPNASCEDTPPTPGHASQASGSAFNPDGNAGTHYAGSDGTPSAEHAHSSHAVSQYDVACYQQSTH